MNQLGQRPIEHRAKDAVHVAIYSTIARHTLSPGDKVIFDGAGWACRCDDDDPSYHGIVDPFLNYVVRENERCWVLLRPGSTVNLKHVWEHRDLENVLGDEINDWTCQGC